MHPIVSADSDGVKAPTRPLDALVVAAACIAAVIWTHPQRASLLQR